MSRKYQITLREPAAECLEVLAQGADLPPATFAAQLINNQLALGGVEGKLRSRRAPLPVEPAVSKGRPPWLEPYGGDPEWRADMWGQIVALHVRYPKLLAWLQDGWWKEERIKELLCLLAYWRSAIDNTETAGIEQETSFQLHLEQFSGLLRQAGGGVTKAWQPGAPPPEWTSGSSPSRRTTISSRISCGRQVRLAFVKSMAKSSGLSPPTVRPRRRGPKQSSFHELPASPRPLPATVRSHVQRIADAAARRILSEQFDSEPVSAASRSNHRAVHQRANRRAPLVKR